MYYISSEYRNKVLEACRGIKPFSAEDYVKVGLIGKTHIYHEEGRVCVESDSYLTWNIEEVSFDAIKEIIDLRCELITARGFIDIHAYNMEASALILPVLYKCDIFDLKDLNKWELKRTLQLARVAGVHFVVSGSINALGDCSIASLFLEA